MKMSKYLYLYLYLTKKYLVLTSNFQVLFIKKCKNSSLFEYIIITCFHTWYELQIALYAW